MIDMIEVLPCRASLASPDADSGADVRGRAVTGGGACRRP
jgi:hypothetical protein